MPDGPRLLEEDPVLAAAEEPTTTATDARTAAVVQQERGGGFPTSALYGKPALHGGTLSGATVVPGPHASGGDTAVGSDVPPAVIGIAPSVGGFGALPNAPAHYLEYGVSGGIGAVGLPAPFQTPTLQYVPTTHSAHGGGPSDALAKSSTPLPNPSASGPGAAGYGEISTTRLSGPPTNLQYNVQARLHETSMLLYQSSIDKTIVSTLPWNKMLLEQADDLVLVVSLKGMISYASSPSTERILQHTPAELLGTSIMELCHPADIPVLEREIKQGALQEAVFEAVFRLRCKSGEYVWLDARGSVPYNTGKNRRYLHMVARVLPVYSLDRTVLERAGGVGDRELWIKMATSGLCLFVSSNSRYLLGVEADELVGTSFQDLLGPTRAVFDQALEAARIGLTADCSHKIRASKDQVLRARTLLRPGHDTKTQTKPNFLLAQTIISKATSRQETTMKSIHTIGETLNVGVRVSARAEPSAPFQAPSTTTLASNSDALPPASSGTVELFHELDPATPAAWPYELRQLEKSNEALVAEMRHMSAEKRKRKRALGASGECANCHTRTTPEWRRGPSGNIDLCNSCGLRWAKSVGRISSKRLDSRSSTGTSMGPSSSSRRDSVASSTADTSLFGPSPLSREVIMEDAFAAGQKPQARTKAEAKETISEGKKTEDRKMGETKHAQTKIAETKSDETKSDETKSDETKKAVIDHRENEKDEALLRYHRSMAERLALLSFNIPRGDEGQPPNAGL